jgi:hypothetical protein
VLQEFKDILDALKLACRHHFNRYMCLYMIKQLLKSRFLDENDVNDVMVLRKLFYEILIMFIAAISY